MKTLTRAQSTSSGKPRITFIQATTLNPHFTPTLSAHRDQESIIGQAAADRERAGQDASTEGTPDQAAADRERADWGTRKNRGTSVSRNVQACAQPRPYAGTRGESRTMTPIWFW